MAKYSVHELNAMYQNDVRSHQTPKVRGCVDAYQALERNSPHVEQVTVNWKSYGADIGIQFYAKHKNSKEMGLRVKLEPLLRGQTEIDLLYDPNNNSLYGSKKSIVLRTSFGQTQEEKRRSKKSIDSLVE